MKKTILSLFFVLFLTFPLQATVTVPPVSLSAIRTPPHFPTSLKILTNAEQVELGPTGVAGTCGKECEAYLKTIQTKKFNQKNFQWMLKKGTPAGKLYAALLLGKCDKKVGKRALKSLRSETTPIFYSPGGSIRPIQAPLGEHAKNLLKNPNY